MLVIVLADEDDCSAKNTELFNLPDDRNSPLGPFSSFACTESAGLGPSGICAIWGDFNGIGSSVIQRPDDRTLIVDIDFPFVVCPRCQH